MMLHIPEVFNREQVVEITSSLANADWQEGGLTAGHQAVSRKSNLQLSSDSIWAKQLGPQVVAALNRHLLFLSFAIPKHTLPPLFNCYQGGGQYGNHVDSAIHYDPYQSLKIRTDLSITVFFNDPEGYEGGELIVEDTYGAHEVKLPAGDAIVYPSTSLHRVEPVTSGKRLAAVTWAQSMIRDNWQRNMLFNLDMTVIKLRQKVGDTEEVLALTNHYHNLLRQWIET